MDKVFLEFKDYIKDPFYSLVLTGDVFGIEEALKLLKEFYSGWEFEPFFIGEEERLIKSLTSYGIFEAKKITIVYYLENFSQNYKNIIIDTVLKTKSPKKKVIFVTEKKDIFEKNGFKIFKFTPLYESEIDEWIKYFVESKSSKIDEDAISMLKLIFGNSRKDISSFLEPLLTEKREIGQKDIIKFNISRDSAVFDAVDNFFNKKLKGTLESFLISESENKFYDIILREVSNLLDIKLKKNVDKFKKMFIIKKYEERCEKWEQKDLKMIFKSFLNLESKIKLGFKSLDTTMIEIYKLLKGGLYDEG